VNSSSLVGVGDAFFYTILNKRHVLLEKIRLPRSQYLIEKLATMTSYLFRLVLHARANDGHNAHRMRVLESDANGGDARTSHYFRRIRYQADQMGHLNLDEIVESMAE
jgi:hypothetical protein